MEEFYTSDPEKEETEAETEEFSYRLVIKDGLRLKSTVKSVLEMMSWKFAGMISGSVRYKLNIEM